MVVTRSVSKAIAAVQGLIPDFEKLFRRLTCGAGCKRSLLANSSEMRKAYSSAAVDLLMAVEEARQQTGNLIHDKDLYGDGLQQAEELHEGLEEFATKIVELYCENKNIKIVEIENKEVVEDKNDDEDDESSPKMMRLT